MDRAARAAVAVTTVGCWAVRDVHNHDFARALACWAQSDAAMSGAKFNAIGANFQRRRVPALDAFGAALSADPTLPPPGTIMGLELGRIDGRRGRPRVAIQMERLVSSTTITVQP